MATPNQMPKRPSKIRQQIVAGLIETRPVSWKKKVLAKNSDGKEVVESEKVNGSELKSLLAQNVSEENVERIARRWL